MRVKILKASDSEYWYSDQIGKVFEVNEELEDDYRLYDANGFGMTIAKDDCELYRNRLESIKERFSKYEFVHSYIDDNCCNQEWNEAHEAMGYLLQRLEKYETALKHVRDYERLEENWEVAKVIDEALKE